MLVEEENTQKMSISLPEQHDKLMLSRLQLFRNVKLDSPEVDELLQQCNYRALEPDEVLLSTDRINKYLYVLVQGRLVIQLSNMDEMPLTTVEPGECVGEMSIIDERVPSAQVRASEPTVVLEVEQEILWRLVSVSHEIARNLLYIMSERVRYSNLVIADSLEMQRKYQRFATIDALTGLHNRGWMDDAFEREIKRTERDSLPLCMMMIDVDRFKQFNDTYGHLAGDQVLIMVGENLRKPLRPNDMVARFGGEEFCVLLPETKIEHAVEIAERLRERISKADPGIVGGQQLPKVTISIGVTEYKPGYALETMIASADVAMYHAKQNGRNRVQVAADV